ncbi:ABC-type transport auxiliary lipoprotein family protein [Candidiatus Paracoxiella cheracis]|uniref:ABC-type transport auxiliary lipoprotein family protein n=1 Tax=Candidiatus Paracoxiella cheracis TaxID=3405120 RepID=UPI003BF4ECAB
MMVKVFKCLAIIFVAIVLTACGPIATKPMNSYTLSSLRQSLRASHPRTKLTLLVSNPIAAPGYQTSAMIYMETPFELESFADNRWVAPPAQMLLPMFVRALRNTSYFYAVVSPPFSGITNLRLDTELIKLQQEFLLPTSRVRLVVQASLISNVTNHVVASRQFEVVVPTSENNPYGGVLAANRAAALISREIAQFAVRFSRR